MMISEKEWCKYDLNFLVLLLAKNKIESYFNIVPKNSINTILLYYIIYIFLVLKVPTSKSFWRKYFITTKFKN